MYYVEHVLSLVVCFYVVETIGYSYLSSIDCQNNAGSIILIVKLTKHINDHRAFPGDCEVISTNCCHHSACVVTRLISHYACDSVG